MTTKVSAAEKEKARILTPEFRVSYPHVFKPNSIQGSKPKYSITMLFDKKQDLKVIKEAMRVAKTIKFGPDQSKWPKNLENPISDGDNVKYADKEGYKGHWAIKASTNEDQKPGVVDEKVQPILDATQFYPGCYARAYVYAYVWEFAGKTGIGFILDHVQKTGEGKSFGGKKPVDQVFTAVNNNEVANEEVEQDFV